MQTTIIENQKAYFDTDAECHGKGSDPYKWVSYLSKESKQIIAAGGLVLVRSNTDYGIEIDGELWKRVGCTRGRYYHRCTL